MRLALHLVAVALVVLAGCGGSPGPEPGDVTADQPTATPAPSPAGLSMETVTDARSLAASHRERLDSHSHTIDYQRTLRYDNGTVFSRTNETHRIGSNGTASYETDIDGTKPLFLGRQPGSVQSWSNESVTVSVISTNESTTYQRQRNRLRRATFDDVYALYTSFDLTVTGRTGTGDETRFHLASRAPTESGIGVGSNTSRNTTLTAAVDGDGVLRHYSLTYTATFDNRTLQATETLRVRDVGETTVPRPEWVDTALDETEGEGLAPATD
jgi:hypothetical protein